MERSTAETEQPYIEASLIYLLDSGDKPVNIPSVPGGDPEQNIGLADPRRVKIMNGRLVAAGFSLERHGFKLIDHRSGVADFYDDAQLPRYAAEVESILRAELNPRRIVVFDFTRRSDNLELMRAKQVRDPAATVHNDYTDRSAAQRVRDLLGDEAPALLARPYAIVNVWRSIAGPAQTSPIALCPAEYIEPGDLIAAERRAQNRVGEIYRLAYGERHRWYYFPRMRPDEALLIKTFDSAGNGRARFAPHAAFRNPAADADAPPRESIEARALLFF